MSRFTQISDTFILLTDVAIERRQRRQRNENLQNDEDFVPPDVLDEQYELHRQLHTQQQLQAGTTPQELLQTGTTPQELAQAWVKLPPSQRNGLTPQSLIAVGVTLQDLYQGGFTSLQMKRAGIKLSSQFLMEGRITSQQMLQSGITLRQMLNDGITLQQIVTQDNVTAETMLNGGVTRKELTDANIQDVPPKGTWRQGDKEIKGAAEARNEAAGATKPYEGMSDIAKIRGKDTDNNPQQFVEQGPNATSDVGVYDQFKDSAAVFGASRDEARFLGDALSAPENAKKLINAIRDPNQKKSEKAAEITGASGSLLSTGVYGGLVAEQAVTGIRERASSADDRANMLNVANKTGNQFQGAQELSGFFKGTASGLGLASKGFEIGNSTMEGVKDKKYKNKKSLGRGVKNTAEIVRGTAGTVKDFAGMAGSAGSSVQEIAGGYVAPGAGIAIGAAETAQGVYKWNKMSQKQKTLTNIRSQLVDQQQIDTVNALKEVNSKQRNRARIKTGVGVVSAGAGITGVIAGPIGLVVASSLGAGIGGFTIGQWALRKIKQKGRDKEWAGFNADKSTDKKIEANQHLVAATIDLIADLQAEYQEGFLTAIGLDPGKRDKVVQDAYEKVTGNRDDTINWDTLPDDVKNLVRGNVITDLLKKR